MYFCDFQSHSIYGVPLSGGDVIKLYTDVGAPEGLAVDWFNSHLYWTESVFSMHHRFYLFSIKPQKWISKRALSCTYISFSSPAVSAQNTDRSRIINYNKIDVLGTYLINDGRNFSAHQWMMTRGGGRMTTSGTCTSHAVGTVAKTSWRRFNISPPYVTKFPSSLYSLSDDRDDSADV